MKINWLNIKNNRYIIIGTLIVIYGIILPLILSLPTTQEGVFVWFSYIQRLLIIPMIILVGYLFKPYVEIEYSEVLRSIHKRNKIFYLINDVCLVQCVMVPFYSLLIFMNKLILPYILIIILQYIVLISLYSVIALITHSTTLSLGLVLCYILLFALILSDIPIMNLFVAVPISYLFQYYYIICFGIVIISLFAQFILEKYH